MLESGTDTESYINEYTLVYEEFRRVPELPVGYGESRRVPQGSVHGYLAHKNTPTP